MVENCTISNTYVGTLLLLGLPISYNQTQYLIPLIVPCFQVNGPNFFYHSLPHHIFSIYSFLLSSTLHPNQLSIALFYSLGTLTSDLQEFFRSPHFQHGYTCMVLPHAWLNLEVKLKCIYQNVTDKKLHFTVFYSIV